MSLDRRTSLMILAALPGLGPVSIRRLDAALPGGADRLLAMPEAERRLWCHDRVVRELATWQRFFDPDKVARELARLDADYLTFEDPGYPDRLLPYGDCPVGLYRRRAGLAIGGRCIALVGTRKPSAYGRKVAREFAHELCRRGFTIVSGLAEGIDTEAHRAALECGGSTLAVLGGGLNRCYPLSNKGLMETITDSGGVWTEFPLWRSADRRSFPQRNRIVAGISEGVVVVESGAAGGSLITARMASEQGKPVYVVPGRIDAPESAGCHALIRDGAQLVTSAGEVAADLDHLPGLLRAAPARPPPAARETGPRAAPQLDGVEARVWEALGERRCANCDALAGMLALSAATVATALLELEMDGHVLRRLDGCYERS